MVFSSFLTNTYLSGVPFSEMFLFPKSSTPFVTSCVFFLLAIMVGVSWNPKVVFICPFLVTMEVEYVFKDLFLLWRIP